MGDDVVRAGELELVLSDGGVTVSSGVVGTLTLETVRVGGGGPRRGLTGDGRRAPCPPDLGCRERLEISGADGSWLEWWTAQEGGGLRQGWELHGAGETNELEVRTPGATWRPDGAGGFEVVTAEGVWTWRELAAWDSAGAPLSLEARAEEDAVRLTVHGRPEQPRPWFVDPVLAPQAGRTAGWSPSGVGDVNGDGFDDVALRQAGGLVILWGGAVVDPTVVSAPLPASGGDAAVGGGDVDGDGDVDLAGMSGDALVWWEGDGAGGWTRRVLSTWPNRPDVHVVDRDGDGFSDIVAPFVEATFVWQQPTRWERALKALQGSPSGPGAPGSLSPLPSSDAVRLTGDLDGDGQLDGALDVQGCTAGMDVLQWVLVGGASGLVAEPSGQFRSYHVGCLERATVVEDVDGDGFDDLVYQTDGLYWKRGGPRGLRFDAERFRDGGEVVSSLVSVGDMNGDGFGDVGVADAGVFEIYLGGPEGPISPAAWTLDPGAVDLQARLVPVGDVNGDGLDDVIGAVSGVAVLWFGQAVDDIDGDGFGEVDDCAPHHFRAHPGAVEVPGDDLDEDCDGVVACYVDRDGDGWAGGTTVTATSCGGAGLSPDDCWDDDPTRGPSTWSEGDDPACAGPRCHGDVDGDGAAAVRDGDLVLVPGGDCYAAGHSWTGDDCADRDATRRPGAPEVVADGVDQNCNGLDRCHLDADGDGFVVVESVERAVRCDAHPDPAAIPGGGLGPDCRDDRPEVHPGAAEVPGSEWDEDCDGFGDCYSGDRDGDGWGGAGDPVIVDASPALGGSVRCPAPLLPGGDCDPIDAAFHPDAPMGLLGADTDCDGLVTCLLDADGDGFGAAFVEASACTDPGFSLQSGDCDDGDADTRPGGLEQVGDANDQDCDGRLSCFRDRDEDGWGSEEVVSRSARGDCRVVGLSDRSGDCAPREPSGHPGAWDPPWDGLDQDCDGVDALHLRFDAETGRVQVIGAEPGARVVLMESSVGPGAGPCPRRLQGGCHALLAPTAVGTATAGVSGRATVPVGAAADARWYQAWVEAAAGPLGSEVLAAP